MIKEHLDVIGFKKTACPFRIFSDDDRHHQRARVLRKVNLAIISDHQSMSLMNGKANNTCSNCQRQQRGENERLD